MEILIGLVVFILILALIIAIIRIPIYIANTRGITGSELNTITVLSWLGLLIGLTWFIALILALVYQPKKWVDKDKGVTNIDLDALEKLSKLKESGVLSQAEFNREKKKLMGQSVEPDLEEELNRLKQLKKKGVLSQAEYDEQRRLLIEKNL